MALETYRKKRDFKVTSEPAPTRGKPHRSPIFVVQEHHASRLHYDFRLESDGVLKSWAVTKEPTLDPSVKRLAVEVEDHPIAYADFSGDIPKGEYGAGHVEIWDRGTYRNLLADKEKPQTVTEGIEVGHLEIELHGKKLKGAFTLVLMKKEKKKRNWLLIKKMDTNARPAATGEGKEAGSRSSSSGEERKRRSNTGVKAARIAPAVRKGSPPVEIELTSPEKIMFPDAGITKRDVFEFYQRIGDRLLPHLRDRPMTLERLPDGLSNGKAPHFWQKDTPSYYPDWIPQIELESERGDPVNYLLVNDLSILLYLVNQGTITFHPWLSRIGSPDHPDYILFDLDPGKGGFQSTIPVARELRSVLRGMGIEGIVKTSGKRGLHLLTPWRDAGDFDVAREWAMEIAEEVVRRLPDDVTVERSKAKRGTRLYLDVMQNVRGHHAVAPYVLRATPAATVSTPLRWEELTSELSPEKFTAKSIFRRLSRLKVDPVASLLEV